MRTMTTGRARAIGLLTAALFILASLAAAPAAASKAAVSPAIAVTLANQDWPAYLHDAARSSATTDATLSSTGAPNLAAKWTYQAGGPIATSASIVGTTAYVGAWDGYEYAINTTTGALVWKTYLGITTDPACNPSTIGITSAAAVVNGVVYVGGGDAYWYALDATTGAVLWKVYTGDNSQAGAHYNWSSPLIAGSYAYIGIASNCDNPLVQGQLLQVAIAGAQQGQILNTYNLVPNGQVGGGIWTSPSYDPATGTIFVSTGTLAGYTQTQSQAIVALNASNLAYNSSWQLPFSASVSDSDWSTTPTLTTDAGGDQLLSVANKNGILYTFNRNNLAAGPVWQRQIALGGNCPTCGDGVLASGIFANGVLYYAGGHNVHDGHGSNGSITALDPGTGNVLWSRQTDAPILGTPANVNGMIGLVQGSTFEVLDAGTGSLLYSYLMPSTAYGAVSVAQGQFYVGTLGGRLYAFGQGSAPATPPADPNCPTGFTCQDIHNPAKGSESSSGGMLTVKAAGSGIKGTGDQFRFISTSGTGDTQTSAEVVSQAPGSGLTQQAGLMIRQTAAGGSPFYAVLSYPNDTPPDVKVYYRASFSQNPKLLRTVPAAAGGTWLMIQRKGNLFSAGISVDGSSYTLIPGSTAGVDLPTATMQGLAVASGSSTTLASATFGGITAGAAVTTTMNPPPPADPCPSAWTCADLGNPSPPGDTTDSAGTLTLAGTGAGFGGGTDSAHYVYQTVTGDTSVSAQVTTASGASGKTQDGLMMRASTAPTAPMYSVYLKPGGTATIQWRAYDGIAYNHNIPLTSVTSPAHLKIVRYTDTNATPAGTYFVTLTSADGSTWTPVLGSAVNIDMGQGSYLSGLAATSGTAGVTTSATFSNVSVAAVTTPPASACPGPWTCADIGAPGVPTGNQQYSGGWTIQAGGDIWSVYDEFRYVYQPFPGDSNGDGSISARVSSQSGGGPWMRSGVMVRSGTDPAAPYYGVFATPANGVIVQWRTAQATRTQQLLGPATTIPVWVKAMRYTDTTHNVVYYSGYSSTDGTNWAFIPGSTVALTLPGQLVAGLASDANSSTNLTVTGIDNVTLGGTQAPTNICPSDWTCADIGGALPPGQDSLVNGVWHETGGGGDIWSTADSFHFAWQTLPADGTVTAHITAQQNTSAWAKAGVMMRATTGPGSPYYGVFVTPGNGIAVQWRTAQGGSTSQVLASGTVPADLMVGRYTTGGQTYYTAYTSPDGSTWTPIAGSTQVIGMTGALLAGIAITSHQQGTASAVTLDTVAVAAGELPPPGLCPSGWTCGDIGTVVPGPGSQTLSGGSWYVTGFGNDIWGSADSFHFVSQPLAADGSISARIVSQTNSSSWAKGGLMMRLTTDPGSPYYAIFTTPGNGIAVQWRSVQAGTTSQATTLGTVPVYVKIVRSGTTYSAYTSPDGGTWTLVPGSTQTLASLTGGLLDGFAVTSHNTGQYNTVGYNSVVATP